MIAATSAGIAMAMAADAANSARPADILAATGIGGEGSAPPRRRSHSRSNAPPHPPRDH
jgi:hypothetical protein